MTALFTGNGPFYLLSFLVSQRDTDHFGECFMCTEHLCKIASDTTDLGWGGKRCPFYPLSPEQEEAEGTGEERLARLRGRRTCYLQAGQGIYSSE